MYAEEKWIGRRGGLHRPFDVIAFDFLVGLLIVDIDDHVALQEPDFTYRAI